ANFGKVAPVDEITILAWVKLAQGRQLQDLFTLIPLEDNRITVHYFPVDNVIHCQFGKPFLGMTLLLPAGITGEWQHFAFVAKSGEFMKIFKNGVKAAQIEGGASFEPSSADWIIGGRPDGLFKGALDDLAIFNMALSEEEIKCIMEKGLSEAMKNRR
ncbi:MAG: LamG domain-containing protein, partial [Desulfocucumaceae bacterium]